MIRVIRVFMQKTFLVPLYPSPFKNLSFIIFSYNQNFISSSSFKFKFFVSRYYFSKKNSFQIQFSYFILYFKLYLQNLLLIYKLFYALSRNHIEVKFCLTIKWYYNLEQPVIIIIINHKINYRNYEMVNFLK